MSNLETLWEIYRWKGENADYVIDDSIHQEGRYALKVQLNVAAYSGVFLFYFQRNWKNAKKLRLSIYNPSREELRIVCRVNDFHHMQGKQLYEDRFNHIYTLAPGWRNISVDLADVKKAPKGRSMDLGQIAKVGIFALNLSRSRVMFIDDVRLEE